MHRGGHNYKPRRFITDADIRALKRHAAKLRKEREAQEVPAGVRGA